MKAFKNFIRVSAKRYKTYIYVTEDPNEANVFIIDCISGVDMIARFVTTLLRCIARTTWRARDSFPNAQAMSAIRMRRQ